ncbi:MAG: hypothetical protein IKT40_14420 [Bacilli bacterium]|nr:hypothetical protein [Bacilli bacterium]
MSEIITTLHKKGDASVEVYPNVKATNIPNNAIDTSKIADNSITTAKIIDNAVTTAKINNSAITNAKILNDTIIGYEKLLDGSVTTDKIGSEEVQTSNIEDGAVTNSKLANNSVYGNNIKDGEITSIKISGCKNHYLVVNFTQSTGLNDYDINTLILKFAFMHNSDTISLDTIKSNGYFKGFTTGRVKILSLSKWYIISDILMNSTSLFINYIDENFAIQNIEIILTDLTTSPFIELDELTLN